MLILPGKTDAKKSSLSGAGLQKATAGVSNDLLLTPKDRFGNRQSDNVTSVGTVSITFIGADFKLGKQVFKTKLFSKKQPCTAVGCLSSCSPRGPQTHTEGGGRVH